MPPKRKKQTGKGLKEVAEAVHNFVKDNKLISRTVGAISPVMGTLTSLTGYGRKKRVVRARKVVVTHAHVVPVRRVAVTRRHVVAAHSQVGGGFFSDLGGGIGNVFGGLGGGIGSVAHGLFGGGRSHPASAPRRNPINM